MAAFGNCPPPEEKEKLEKRVFEMTISFPMDSELTISVFDHDLIGSDDLIGETKLDLENRFYSNHRANCGLALQYDVDGYNAWRDAFKPCQILSALCKKHSLPIAEYRREEVKVNNKIFKIPIEAFPEEAFLKDKNKEDDELLSGYDEHKALHVLQHWYEMPEFGTRLVPEHGSLHMWIDLFPTDVPAPPPVNIKPREPVSYELRVIIWNTDDVILDDINPFTGEPSSDIYVKGWIRGLEGEKQETDVHFNSLTGEGNFNWRFVYRFDYLPTEKEITYKKKESIFSLEESEFREPAVLALQVWDYDRISANDFLGSIELKLSDMVRGAKTSQQCTIKMAKDKATPRFSIFRNKRMKGWWPFVKLKSEEDIEREEREAEEKSKKKKKKRKHVRIEDVQYTDTSGNVYILAPPQNLVQLVREPPKNICFLHLEEIQEVHHCPTNHRYTDRFPGPHPVHYAWIHQSEDHQWIRTFLINDGVNNLTSICIYCLEYLLFKGELPSLCLQKKIVCPSWINGSAWPWGLDMVLYLAKAKKAKSKTQNMVTHSGQSESIDCSSDYDNIQRAEI
ncbi:hypothetical protein AB205_0125580 [Aquarana catesbeiana]|uniref:C2 domain-containing protein n=1 Tax=Aquarana catesbeiana TaxID=8400 RepID=A0A2G9NWN6_AQUCT|nr:hypothetical protein AB205_0125580 [Aquarana catesbeiana]